MLYIGVDLGTSAVKLLLMDESGKVLNIVSKEYPISFPKPGWSEQNPCDWWEQTVAGLIELTKDFDRSAVAGISFGGQMHGLVVLDENDEVIRPAILWNDGRTQKETDYLNNVIGKEKLSELTGNIAFAGFTAPKLLWLKANEPENFAKIKKLMLPKDYIAYRMTGVLSTDYSDASGMLLLDVKNTDRADMLQAVFEGVAYGLRDSLEVAKSLGVAPKSTTICGGGAKSKLWRKIVANVMNMQVDTVEVEEGPAYGGAILAAVANGCFENVEAAAEAIVRKKDTTMPSPQLVEKYEKGYAKFKQFYPALKGKY